MNTIKPFFSRRKSEKHGERKNIRFALNLHFLFIFHSQESGIFYAPPFAVIASNNRDLEQWQQVIQRISQRKVSMNPPEIAVCRST